MTIFRWVIGVLAVSMAALAVVSFLLSTAAGAHVWSARARRFRHWTWLALLLWFNVEVWGRVLLTLIRWNR